MARRKKSKYDLNSLKKAIAKKSKYDIFVLLFIGLFLLSGCIHDTGVSAERPTFGGVDDVLVAGEFGLQTTLLTGNPPTEVFEGNPFDIVVNLENKGETNIPAGNVILEVSGLDANSYGLDAITKTNSFGLEGTSIAGTAEITGGSEQITFSASRTPVGFSGVFLETLNVDVCYDYQTRVTANSICMGDDPQATTCVASGEKLAESTTAPIEVTSIEQIPQGTTKNVSFTIKITDKGTGLLYSPGANCAIGNLNKVVITNVSSVKFPETIFSCEGTEVGLINGEKIVRCQSNTEIDIAEETNDQIKVTLDYGYEVKLTKAINIKEV